MPRKEMIRNVDMDFVYQQMDVIGISPKEMCARLGKGDSYLGAIKRNGMPLKLLSIMATWLEIDDDDSRLFIGGEPLTDETIVRDVGQTSWSVRDSNELHKMRSDVALIRRTINVIAKELGIDIKQEA